MPVTIDISGSTAVLTLDNPERHNALTREMFTAMSGALDKIESEHHGRLLRIRGSGPSFCSGFDLDECRSDETALEHFLTELSRVARRLRRMRRIVVAEVQGRALAGGCALLTACDVVCASRDARIGYPVHRIGLSPAVSIPTLVNCIGYGHATDLMLSGSIVDGVHAHRIGLVHLLADSGDELGTMVDRTCVSLEGKGEEALMKTKDWMNMIDGSDEDAPFDETLAASVGTGRSEEAARLLASVGTRK